MQERQLTDEERAEIRRNLESGMKVLSSEQEDLDPKDTDRIMKVLMDAISSESIFLPEAASILMDCLEKAAGWKPVLLRGERFSGKAVFQHDQGRIASTLLRGSIHHTQLNPMDDATKEMLLEISRLLWSIGDSFDEMDHTGRNLWERIRSIEDRTREVAVALDDSGEIGKIRREILQRRSLHLWWSSIVDSIQELTDGSGEETDS